MFAVVVDRKCLSCIGILIIYTFIDLYRQLIFTFHNQPFCDCYLNLTDYVMKADWDSDYFRLKFKALEVHIWAVCISSQVVSSSKTIRAQIYDLCSLEPNLRVRDPAEFDPTTLWTLLLPAYCLSSSASLQICLSVDHQISVKRCRLAICDQVICHIHSNEWL